MRRWEISEKRDPSETTDQTTNEKEQRITSWRNELDVRKKTEKNDRTINQNDRLALEHMGREESREDAATNNELQT